MRKWIGVAVLALAVLVTALVVFGTRADPVGTPATAGPAAAGIGARVELQQRFEFGAVYEFALTDPDDDIMDQRFTVDFILRW